MRITRSFPCSRVSWLPSHEEDGNVTHVFVKRYVSFGILGRACRHKQARFFRGTFRDDTAGSASDTLRGGFENPPIRAATTSGATWLPNLAHYGGAEMIDF